MAEASSAVNENLLITAAQTPVPHKEVAPVPKLEVIDAIASSVPDLADAFAKDDADETLAKNPMGLMRAKSRTIDSTLSEKSQSPISTISFGDKDIINGLVKYVDGGGDIEKAKVVVGPLLANTQKGRGMALANTDNFQNFVNETTAQVERMIAKPEEGESSLTQVSSKGREVKKMSNEEKRSIIDRLINFLTPKEEEEKKPQA